MLGCVDIGPFRQILYQADNLSLLSAQLQVTMAYCSMPQKSIEILRLGLYSTPTTAMGIVNVESRTFERMLEEGYRNEFR